MRYITLRVIRYYIRAAFSRRSRISRSFATYHIKDILLVLCTNIAEAHFLTECASRVESFLLVIVKLVGKPHQAIAKVNVFNFYSCKIKG